MHPIAARGALLLGLAWLPCTAAAAQPAPAYRRAPGDTLVYHEVTRTASRMTVPGPATVQSEALHDARIAVAFPAPDTAVAWYEALELFHRTGTDVQAPSTAGVLRRPFRLLFRGRGVAATLSAPRDAVKEATDLRWQFFDFFPCLPAAPLRPGLEWADTLAGVERTEDGKIVQESIIRYRVVGDSVVAGRRVAVVALESEGTATIGGLDLAEKPYVLVTTTRAQGRAYLAPDPVVFVGRTLRGSATTVPGAEAHPLRMEIVDEFTSTIELVSPPRP